MKCPFDYEREVAALLGPWAGRTVTVEDPARLGQLRAGSADTVVSVLALGRTADVAAALEQIQRVLAPGGRLVFVEQVAAPPGSWRRRWQWLLGPLWRLGTPLGRAPRDLWNDLKAARFARLNLEKVDLPGWAGLPVPHMIGTALGRIAHQPLASLRTSGLGRLPPLQLFG